MAAYRIATCFSTGERLVLRLLEDLGQLLAAVELVAGGLVEVRRELGERRQLAVLGEVELERAGDLLHRLGLGGRADARTEMPMFRAGRWPALNRSVSRKIWPSVIEMTLVGM